MPARRWALADYDEPTPLQILKAWKCGYDGRNWSYKSAKCKRAWELGIKKRREDERAKIRTRKKAG